MYLFHMAPAVPLGPAVSINAVRAEWRACIAAYTRLYRYPRETRPDPTWQMNKAITVRL